MVIYYAQVFLIIYTCASASHDGRTYRINGKPSKPYIQIKNWLKWWHIDNSLEYAAVLGVVGMYEWPLVVYGLLIRVSLFDPCYNNAADLPKRHIGTTAWYDRIFYKIFKNLGGAIGKAIFFLLLLTVANYIKYKFL